MKRYLFPLFILFSLQGEAQKIHFGDPTNYWGFLSRREDAGNGHTFYYVYSSRGYSTSNTIVDSNKTYVYLYDYFYRSAYIYEDTTAGKIFCRLSQTDTTDLLLFDYNLNTGDTFTSPVKAPGETVYSKCVIQNIDSIKLNGHWHRRFHGSYFQPYPEPFIFLEGIGAKTPLMTLTGSFPGDTWPNDMQVNLSCFTNKGNIPMKDNGYLFYCQDSVLNIDDYGTGQKEIKLYPQPATSVVHIQLPAVIKSGNLAVYNQLGQVVVNNIIANKEFVEINNTGNLHGLYYYRITDNTENKVYSGKMLFE